MNLAKQILGYGCVIVSGKGDQDKHKYSLDKLGEILKTDEQKIFTVKEELDIRDSFDNFLVFLGKIGYSLKVGAIKRHEILFLDSILKEQKIILL